MSDDQLGVRYREQRYAMIPVDLIDPDPSNPNEGDVGAIVQSLDANGFFGAAALWPQPDGERYTLIAGEHRWRSVIARGGPVLPSLIVEDVASVEEARRMLLADNRTARLGRDRPDRLVPLLADMADGPMGLAGTGYDDDDLDHLLAQVSADSQLPDPDRETFGLSLPERMENYVSAAQRQIVLPYSRNVHQWLVHQLDQMAQVLGLHSNAEVILHLVAEAAGEQPPPADSTIEAAE